MSNADEGRLETVQRQIQALLERANHPNTPQAEKDTALEKASRLALKYRIDVSVLSAQKKLSREPEWREFPIDYRTDFPLEMADMHRAILKHHGIKAATGHHKTEAYGYHDDFVLAEMMWTSVQLHFLTTIAPKWNDAKSFEENVYTIKQSGRSWAEIVEMAPREYGLTMKSGGKLRTAYRKWAEKLGESVERQPGQPARWRKSFAESYCSTIVMRLARMARDQEASEEQENPEGTIALRNDAEKVAEEFYAKFPHLRPWTKEQYEEYRRKRAEKEQEEAAAYAAMSPKERARHDREKEAAQRKYERWAARNQPDEAGWAAGNAAGKKADLGTDARVSQSSTKELS